MFSLLCELQLVDIFLKIATAAQQDKLGLLESGFDRINHFQAVVKK
jgi:hypothetical protein